MSTGVIAEQSLLQAVTFPAGIAVGTAAGIGSASAASMLIGIIPAAGAAAGTGAASGVAGVPTPPLDGLGATAAYSLSRDLLTSFIGGTRYTLSTGKINLVTDQTGNSRHLAQTEPTTRPIVETAGSNNRDAISFDGTDDYMVTAGVISNFITASTGYMICSMILDVTTTNSSTVYDNDGIVSTADNYLGIFAKTASGGTIQGYNYDGSPQETDHVVTPGDTLVVEWKHTGGVLSTRVNGGTWATISSGNSASVGGTLVLGGEISGSPNFTDVRVIEFASFSSVLTTGQENALAANLLAWAGV